MRDERFQPHEGSEAENKDNVFQFPKQDKPLEVKPKPGTHAASLAILKMEGFDSIAKARIGLEKIEDPKHHRLIARMIRSATITAAQEGIVEEEDEANRENFKRAA